MDFERFSAKTLDDAITEACKKFTVTSDKLEYEIVEEGSSGFLGLKSKPYIINARVKEDKPEVEDIVTSTETTKTSISSGAIEETAKRFLKDVFTAMNLAVVIEAKYDEGENTLDVDLSGDEMGVLIGKRGQTLDSLQYLVSLVINKEKNEYVRVKLDTENYRKRRKDTLENLAKNIAFKVKRTKRSVSLEPMNPYERRIIHSALQNDRYVTTHSEGEEPFRRVIISLKK